MDLNLRDKHILITGGSKGIGLACAHAFLEEGARVSLVSRDMRNLEAARTLLQALFCLKAFTPWRPIYAMLRQPCLHWIPRKSHLGQSMCW